MGPISERLSFPLQVCLFFQNQLFRGNRATKVDARKFAAFCSPNLPALATVGADITSKLI
jgi:L-asparaginase/Glu-tRNA(Gln) amidotransferase subunit D